MKNLTYETEILRILKENDTIKQEEIKTVLFENGIKTTKRNIRLSIENLRRKVKVYSKGDRLYIVSGNFGYSLQPIHSKLTKQFIGLQNEKIKTMTETLNYFTK